MQPSPAVFAFLATLLLSVSAAPIDITFTGSTYTPPSTWNEVVGSFTVTDSDPSVQYHAMRVVGGPDRAVFNVNDFNLRITRAGEGKTTLTVVIRAIDWDNNFVDRTFNITAINVPPTDLTLTPSVYTPPSGFNQVVGILDTMDANTDQAHVYTIVGGADAASFTILGDNLVFATAGITQTGMQVTIKSDDPDYSVTKNLVIDYINVPPTALALSSSTYTPPSTENLVVGTLTTTDNNFGDVFTYTIENVMEGNLFNIQGDQLRVKHAGEARTDLMITVTTTDSGGLKLSQNFTITTLNVAPSRIIVTPNYYDPTNSLAWEGVLTVEDANPEQSSHTYQLVGGADLLRFSLAGDRLSFASTQTGTGLEVQVLTNDMNGGTYTETLVINTINIGPAEIYLTPHTYTPPSIANLLVGLLTALDPNPEQDHVFTLPADDPVFKIEEGYKLTFINGGVMQTGLIARVTASDGAANLTRDLVINYTNVAPADIYFASGATYAPPTAAGTVLGTLAVLDYNDGDFHSLSIPTSADFEIVGNELRARVAGLREGVYTLSVTATDSQGASFTKQLNVTAVNVNPSDIVLSMDTYVPPSTANQTVGVFSAVDGNLGQTHNFTILPSHDGALFNLGPDGVSLRITAAGQGFNHVYIEMRVMDNMGGYYDKLIRIKAKPTAPHSLTFIGSTVFYPPSPINFAVGTLVGEDYNQGDILTYQVVGGDDMDAFYLMGNVLYMAPGQTSRFLYVDVAVFDPRRSKTINLTFTSLNIAPSEVLLSYTHYVAPASASEFVGMLSSVDDNAEDTHTYTIVGGHDAYAFSISGDSLYVAQGTTNSPLSVIIRTTDQEGAFADSSFEVTAGGCPPGYSTGPRSECWQYVAAAATYVSQQDICKNLALDSALIGAGGIASALDSADMAQLDAVISSTLWLQGCEGLNQTGNSVCARYSTSAGCVLVPCTENHGVMCTVPMGTKVMTPYQTSNMNLATAGAFLPSGDAVVVYASQKTTAVAALDQYSYLYREMKTKSFGLELTTYRLDDDAMSGILVNANNTDYFAIMTGNLVEGGVGKCYYIITAVAGTVTASTPVPLLSLPVRMRLDRHNDNIRVALHFGDGVTAPIYLSHTVAFPMDTVQLGIATYSQAATTSFGGSLTSAQYSAVAFSQGEISVVSTIPGRATINVSEATPEFVVYFDREVSPGAGFLEFSVSNAAPILIPISEVNITGTNMTFSPPTPLAAATTYYLDIPRGFVTDTLSQDAFLGLQHEWIFATAPTPASQSATTDNITLALDTTLDRFSADAFCEAIQTLFSSIMCHQIEYLSITSGSVVVVFRIHGVAAPAVDGLMAQFQTAFYDNSLSEAMVQAGQGAILVGSGTIATTLAQEMPQFAVTLHPSTVNSPTQVQIVAKTTLGGLPAGGYVEIIFPTPFVLLPLEDMLIKLEVNGAVQRYNATVVSQMTVGFETAWPFEVNEGNDLHITFESGVQMPAVCWGLNEWIWGIRTYAYQGGPVRDYKIMNPPTDQCNGQFSVKKNSAPHITMEAAIQWTYEDTVLKVSKPIKVHDDADMAADARLTATLSLEQPGSKLQLWPTMFVPQGVSILNGTDNSSYIRLDASPFQLQYALANLFYYPAPSFSGSEVLTLVVEDNGYCCDLVPESANFSTTFYVIPVNNAPVMEVTGGLTRSIAEDTNLTFSCIISDVDAGGDLLEVNVSVTHGTLDIIPNLILNSVFEVGATQTSTFRRLTGSQANLNKVLTDMRYTPTPNLVTSVTGPGMLTCVGEDLGHGPIVRDPQGLLPGLTFPDSTSLMSNTVQVAVTVIGINDAPTLALLGPTNGQMQVAEDTTTSFQVALTDIDPSPSMANLGTGNASLVIGVIHGGITSNTLMLSAATVSGVTEYTATATLAALNAATFTYMPPKDWYGMDTVTVDLMDSGVDGATGPSMTAHSNMTIIVTPVNDPPALLYVGDADEHGHTIFHRDTIHTLPVNVTDVDVYEGELDLYVNASHGLVYLASPTGLTVLEGDITSGSPALRVRGTVNVLTAALEGLRYRDQFPHRQAIYHITEPVHNMDEVYLYLTDRGHSGSGGTFSDSLTIPLRVTSTLYDTCQDFLNAFTSFCGCYFKTTHPDTPSHLWTRLPTSAPSSFFLESSQPRQFMQGCCADMLPWQRTELLVRDGELGLCR